MKFKLGLAALFLSVSVLLLQSTSFSTAEIRNDVTMSVVDEDHALIAITDWDGRFFSVVNNTGTDVVIESMAVMGGEMLGVEGWPAYLGAGEVGYFTLIGEAMELSTGKEIWMSASWESGRADIIASIPYFVEEVFVGVNGGLLDSKEVDEKSDEKVEKEAEPDEETAPEESVNPDTAVDDTTDETTLIEDNNPPEADQKDEADEQ